MDISMSFVTLHREKIKVRRVFSGCNKVLVRLHRLVRREPSGFLSKLNIIA